MDFKEIKLILKQKFCRHKLRFIAKNKHSNETLFMCRKCGAFYILHKGMHLGYLTRKVNLNDWIFEGE